ncbi:unnamed protein product [Calicophoron daubneyi]|uniref:Prokaryotic-type class I peptide chain release factors domain-containing protein n=1 Tax=Calicophoron daubneyi TaxID=300641 RepID=A0AAV2TPG0_CALDB
MITDIIKKEDDDDDELIEIARLEKEQREKQRQALEQKLLWLISPPTPFALVPGAQLELIAGAGGREAGLFARDLLDMYRSFAAYRGWSFTVTQEATMSGSEATGGASETPLSKACVEIVGRPEEECPGTSMDSSKVLGAFGQLCWEAGVHRVQRIPVTSGQHKIHTSTVAVSVLPITEETDIEIPEGELKWEYYRSSGAGGQHVNKTDSAVRLTHLPTGTVVTCQQERSQLANKQLAFEKLLHKLRTERWRAQWEAMDTMRRSHVGNLDRSEKIRTYNFPQDRVTDHRLGRTWNGLSRFMRQSLGLSEMIQALVERDQFARLEEVLTGQKEKE